MKKVLSSILIFIILTNFIFINLSYASGTGNTFTQDNYDDLVDDGTVATEESGGKKSEYSTADMGDTTFGTIIGFLAKIINAIPMMFQSFLTIFLNTGGIIEANCTQHDVGVFSIQNIIIGKYLILDGNIFRDLNKEKIDASWGSTLVDTLKGFRTNVSMWFIILRDIAIVINLVVLVYIAIRMAIATIASDKAKYKELLYNWVVSMAILFLLPYLMSIVNAISELLISIARTFMDSIENSSGASFENEILESTFGFIQDNGGFRVALYSIVYWVLLWIEVKFLTMYMKRSLTIFFLVMISPIITVTYAVDKIADRKAQAFDKWLHEYAENLLIQPLHCYIYLVFMYMANNIAIEAPLVGVIFLMSLTKGEKIVKSLLGVAGVSIKQVGDEFSLKSVSGALKKAIPKPGSM